MRAEASRERRGRRLKKAGLTLCLFVVLCVVFGSVFRASPAGTFLGALCGTPLAIHVFHRLAPARATRKGGVSMVYQASFVAGVLSGFEDTLGVLIADTDDPAVRARLDVLDAQVRSLRESLETDTASPVDP